MQDPTALIELLHQHLQAALRRPITNRPLEARDIKPGTAEFTITDVNQHDAVDVMDNNDTFALSISGYVACHYDRASTALAALPDILTLKQALNTYWELPQVAEEDAVQAFVSDQVEVFLNTVPNTGQGPVLTFSVDWTLKVNLSTS